MPESAKECDTVLPEGLDIGLGPGDRAFEPHYSDQVMIIRTTLSKLVMCSDLSFLLRIFCKSKGGNENSCPCISSLFSYNEV